MDNKDGAIDRIIDMVECDELSTLSTGEQIIAALLYNRLDWLPEGYDHVLSVANRNVRFCSK